MAVEFLDVGVGGRGLTDAQACAIVGWQDDGADLMGFEDVAYRRPRCMDAVVEQGLLDRDQQMIGQHTKKNVGVDATLQMVPNRPFSERRFHVTKGVLGAREQDVYPPELVA